MKIRLFVFTIYSVFFINCSGDKNTSASEGSEAKDSTKVNVTTIEALNYTDYALSPEGESELTKWEKYQELAIQINYLKKGDLSFFNGDKEALKKFIDEFRTSIPEKFKTNPIISRVVIIETALLKLNENLTLDNIDGRLKLLSVKEIFVAFSNLNYQINKKLERDIFDKIQPEQ